jgi:threonine synthase
MVYISTRDTGKKVSGAQAIVKGISEDGGLFIPESIPSLSKNDIKKMLEMDYSERAAYIMKFYLPDFSYEELLECAARRTESMIPTPPPLLK